MIHRLLCKLGIHAWTKWWDIPLTGTSERTCIVCDREECRWLPRKKKVEITVGELCEVLAKTHRKDGEI